MKLKRTIRDLHEALQLDLSACQSEFERSNCKAIGGREIISLANSLLADGKLTAADARMASLYGRIGAPESIETLQARLQSLGVPL